jgi:hypothetical protein
MNVHAARNRLWGFRLSEGLLVWENLLFFSSPSNPEIWVRSLPAPWRSIMRTRPVSLAVVFFLAALLSATSLRSQDTSREEVLSNDDVVKMVQAHLGADVIIEQIRNSPGKYSLTANSLVRLKQQGVPDKVIAAMQAKKGASPGTPTDGSAKGGSAASSSPAPDKPPQSAGHRTPAGVWRLDKETDRMTGISHEEALMWRPTVGTKSKGELQVKATCNGSSLLFSINLFAPIDDPKMGFKQNTYGQTVIPGGLLGAAVMAARHAKPWVEMRVKLDDNPPIQASSENDYINAAAIYFYTPSAQTDGAAAIIQVFANAKSVGTVEQALRAQTILVEMTLDDDDKEILEIKPQDPDFKTYSARCAFHPPEGFTESAPASGGFHSIGSPKSDAQSTLASGTAVGEANLEARTFKGNADGFASALSGFIQQASASGLPAEDFGSEVQYIVATAHACGQITTEMIAAGTDSHGITDPSRFQEQYIPCLWGAELNVSSNARRGDPRSFENLGGSLMMTIKPHARWGDGNGFTMSISWAKGFVPYYEKRKATDYLKIVEAEIGPSSGALAAPSRTSGVLGAPIGSPIPSPERTAIPISRNLDEHVLRLTRVKSSEARTATITAPGNRQHSFNVFSIDTRDFDRGGTLVIDIDIPRSSATDGSFDLFPGNIPVPPQAPTPPLTGSYDVHRGSSTHLKYRFERGQVFALGLEGNWFSPKGATGQVQFRAHVE